MGWGLANRAAGQKNDMGESGSRRGPQEGPGFLHALPSGTPRPTERTQGAVLNLYGNHSSLIMKAISKDDTCDFLLSQMIPKPLLYSFRKGRKVAQTTTMGNCEHRVTEKPGSLILNNRYAIMKSQLT